MTNIQYAAFVQDGGYSERWRRCWTDAGWRRRTTEWHTASARSLGGAFDRPNHPVVDVSWYEAVAFCNWLSEKLGQRVMLPSEAQWEKAARGVDGRCYPWGNAISPEHANYAETGLGTTSAVGIFPRGESPCGALDMAGNVWEWTSSRPQLYPYAPEDGQKASESDLRRMLRGGSFRSDACRVRCAVRLGVDPDLGGVNCGFRVVSSPGS